MRLKFGDQTEMNGLKAFEIYENFIYAYRENKNTMWELAKICYEKTEKASYFKIINNPILEDSGNPIETLKKFHLLDENEKPLPDVSRFIIQYILVTQVGLHTTSIFNQRVYEQLNKDHPVEFQEIYRRIYRHEWNAPSTLSQLIGSCNLI